MPAFDSRTTRMPHGVTNAAPFQTMGAAGAPDPSWAATWHEDFFAYLATLYTLTVTGTAPTAAAAGANGRITTTTSTGATDAGMLQLKTNVVKPDGKDIFFKILFQLSDVAGSNFFCGLLPVGSVPASATDGIYINKASGTSAPSLVIKVGGVTTTTAFPSTAVLQNNVDVELGIHIDYLGNVECYFNPTTGEQADNSSLAAVGRGRDVAVYAPSLPTALLTPSFGIANSTGVSRVLTVDYFTFMHNR